MSEHGPVEEIDILLVEDNPGDIRLTQEAFKDAQIRNTLHIVEDGVEALDFLFQRNEYADVPRPALVLLDLNLPRKSGHEVLGELHAEPTLRRIPIIVLTSSKEEQDVVKSYDLCTNAYLTKPVDPLEFLEIVHTIEDFWFSIVHLPSDVELDG